MINNKDYARLEEIARRGHGGKPKTAKLFFNKVISEIIRQDGKCARCEKYPNQLAHAHIMPREHKAVCWLRRNGLPLCYGCHRWFDVIQGQRIQFIFDEDYRWPQMQWLLALGYTHQELLKMAIAARQTWDGNYHAVAAQLLSYLEGR